MNLVRLYAYLIEPQRITESESDYLPTGSSVPLTLEIEIAIQQAIIEANFPQRTEVNFSVNTKTRTNNIRDNLIFLSFGTDDEAEQAALTLATNLSMAMDRRSSQCLFIPLVLESNGEKNVILWTFPRDNAFQFRYDDQGAHVDNLPDVFSQTSRLRKAASFSGTSAANRNDFMTGRVFDSQSRSSFRKVADFWIDRFLNCQPAISPDAGTRMLADCLRDAHEKCADSANREQLSYVTGLLRTGPMTRLSLNDVADKYLTGKAKDKFLRAGKCNCHLEFDFRKEVFESTLKFQVFELETGVYVSSPFGEIGRSVQVDSKGETKTLRCEGIVCDEKMRIRHAG